MAKNKKPNRPQTRPATDGAGKQQQRRERLEARRAAKAAEYERRRKQARRERLIRAGILTFIGVSLFWFIFLRNQVPTEIEGRPITQLSNAGVNEHTSDPVTYESTPGVSGAHAPGVLPCGVYDQQLPDETQVHMLEHGAVGVVFDPLLDPEEIARIEELVASYDENVFSAPYQGLPESVVVTSWSRLMNLDAVDIPAIEGYIEAFAGKGPERGQSCPNEEDSPFELPTAEPSPGESPDLEGAEDAEDGDDGADTGDEEEDGATIDVGTDDDDGGDKKKKNKNKKG